MEKAKSSIFYSWQSDLDQKTTRSFIEDALRRAIKALKKDETLDVEPVMDRDTQDVPGSPDIAKTILEKIELAQIFVGDVSIINHGAKPTPNPNVIYELAYARRALGGERVIMVMNTAYGAPRDLPFDLRQHRTISYNLPKEIDDESLSRAEIRKNLETRFKEHILAILKRDKPQQPSKAISLAEQALIAVKEDRRDQIMLVQDYINDLAAKIPPIAPIPNSPLLEMREQFNHALSDSMEMVVEFAQFVKASTGMQADEIARAIYRNFASILDVTNYPKDFQGIPQAFTHDCAKFLSHELFVIFFSFLLHRERWELITNLLNEDLYPQNARFGYAGVSFNRLSENPSLLYEEERDRRRAKTPLHARLLNERHTQGELAKLVPMEHFMAADFFLFLCSPLAPLGYGQEKQPTWMPWSSADMQDMPRFLQEAIHTGKAQRLASLLKVEDIPSLRAKLKEYRAALEPAWGVGPMLPLYYAFRRFDFDAIGSESR